MVESEITSHVSHTVLALMTRHNILGVLPRLDCEYGYTTSTAKEPESRRTVSLASWLLEDRSELIMSGVGTDH